MPTPPVPSHLVTPPVYVAAGGGGDAIAAWALHSAQWPGVRPVIATFAWDRLMIDPIPGPRSADDFDGLAPIDDLNLAFTPRSLPKPPAGSTMPRLASELDATFVLLDPRCGVTGLRDQLRSLVRTMSAARIVVVDVGGDALAAGHEPGLSSPLADALAVAAASDQHVPIEVHVVGVGLDGELPTSTILDYLVSMNGVHVQRLSADDARQVLPVLDWHPSEATALSCAAALGLRGTVEIREQGHVVELADTSPDVFAVDHGRVLAHSATARALQSSQTLDEAEQAVRAVCGRSELDHERRKADHRRSSTAPIPPLDELVVTVNHYCAEAHQRGVDYVTFRRLAEVTGLAASDAARLRHRLIVEQPARYLPPLWSVRRRPVIRFAAG